MITLSKSGNAVKFTFDENDHYLQNGTIEVPVNSLALIMDDSDMVTFRKSASNDIFVSANYAEFGMSKAELEAWYKTYMVGSSGGGGGTGGTTPEEVQQMIDASLIPYSTTNEVDSMIDESVSGKADSSAVDTLNNTVTAHTADTTIQDDLGADSLDVVDLLMTIEDEFEVEVPDTEIENLKTVGDLVKYIEDNK